MADKPSILREILTRLPVLAQSAAAGGAAGAQSDIPFVGGARGALAGNQVADQFEADRRADRQQQINRERAQRGIQIALQSEAVKNNPLLRARIEGLPPKQALSGLPTASVRRDLLSPELSNKIGSSFGLTPEQMGPNFQLSKDEVMALRRASQTEKSGKELSMKLEGMQEKKDILKQKQDLKTKQTLQKATSIVNTVDRALEKVNSFTTGFIGDISKKIAGSSARDLERLIDTVQANIGFRELNAMRAASPTGGALGQVAVRELELLQATLGSLNQDQSPDQLAQNLKIIRVTFDKIKRAIEGDETVADEMSTIESIEGGKDAVKIGNFIVEEVE